MRRMKRILVASVCALATGRATADGELDGNFGAFGKSQFRPASHTLGSETGEEIALQPGTNKLIVAASLVGASGAHDFGAMRLNANGQVDPTFGDAGVRVVAFDRNQAPATDDDLLTGLAIQSDGKILLMGTATGDSANDHDFAVARLTADGALDTSFGNAGKAIVAFNLNPQGSNYDVGVRIDATSDGRSLLAGYAQTSASAFVMAIARLTSTGQRDTTFDLDGRVTVAFPAGPAIAYRAKQLRSGGTIVVGAAAAFADGSNFDFAIAKLLDNGSLDPTFGVDGKTVFSFDIGGDLNDFASDVIEDIEGRLLVCGTADVIAPENSDMACVRFLPDGLLDTTFPPMLVSFDMGGSDTDFAFRLAEDASGRYLMVGSCEVAPGNSDFAIARFLPNGSLDERFGTGGKLAINNRIVQFGPERDNTATGLAIDPDGGILLAGKSATQGTAPNFSAYEFQVVRLVSSPDDVFASGFED